ncbi:MAG: 3'(2'),5'-bisphosphate nucleotidase CysQ [Lysobacter sp.]|nr:3'(2'),5'-bisphosphate nucleotidase CysQ [Lysobacter sp.]
MKIDDTLREGAIALAHRAAEAILEIYEGKFEVERKSDQSPLTAADLAAHNILVEGLEALTPDIPVLSEEAAEDATWNVRREWRRLWLVDPLDGTREFVKRNGEFSVNLALIEDGVAIFGVVQAPVTGDLYHATKGGPAFHRKGDGEIVLQARRPATQPLRVAASRSHRDERTDAFIARMGPTEPLSLGSSLKFCRIAEGGLDVYPRFGPTSEWDTAAGQVVVEGAGGFVVDAKGRPLRYNQRETLLNGDFLAVGDPDLPWREWMQL